MPDFHTRKLTLDSSSDTTTIESESESRVGTYFGGARVLVEKTQ